MNLKEDLKAGDEITIQIAPFGEYPAESVGTPKHDTLKNKVLQKQERKERK